MGLENVPLHRYSLAVGFWLLAAGQRRLLMDIANVPLRRYGVAGGFPSFLRNGRGCSL